MLHNNEYSTDLIRKPPPPHKQNTHTEALKSKMGYLRLQWQICKKDYDIFQDTRVKIAFRTHNTIQNIIKPQEQKIIIAEVVFTKWNA
jgi:hypothetical protein